MQSEYDAEGTDHVNPKVSIFITYFQSFGGRTQPISDFESKIMKFCLTLDLKMIQLRDDIIYLMINARSLK